MKARWYNILMNSSQLPYYYDTLNLVQQDVLFLQTRPIVTNLTCLNCPGGWGERFFYSATITDEDLDNSSGKLYVRNQEEKKLGLKMGSSLDKVITMDDLVSSNDVFFAATGITDGELLGGVRYMGHGAETESLVIRGKTGTVRWINAKHNFEKLNPLSQIEY